MEVGLIRRVDIDQEMQQSYLDYAMSVIVSRALPDARDGLKPVQRRVLYAMYDMGLRENSAFKKSARIVGEVLGKYHPHGDVAVYESMARLAQEFSMRYPLVDGQGNFGSVDGDPPAAMRYTEARLKPFAMELLSQLDRNTVDFGPNFDGTLEEPLVLPAAVPNLLVNGASGIAVGMATNIPPHNLNEVVNALMFMIKEWDHLEDISVNDLMKYVQGPDFPTGGIILQENGSTDLNAAYASGRGKVLVRGRVHAEDMGRGRSRLIITELPYMTNKSSLIERIAELVREGTLDGIADLRDESDRQGMRIVIELNKAAESDNILRKLYHHTPLQSTFGIALLALVDNEPRMLTLKQALKVYIEHRIEVIKRRSQFDLDKAKARAHIIEGLRIAINNLDEVISLIRNAPDVETARTRLMKQFKLSEIQATAILDMPLRRLAALERKKIEMEYRELEKLIKELEALLHSPRKMRDVVGTELLAVQQTYGDHRRTQIVVLKEGESSKALLTANDMTPAHKVWVGVNAEGRIGRVDVDKTAKWNGPDAPVMLLRADTHQTLYLVTDEGRAAAVGVGSLPSVEQFSSGVPFYKASPLEEKDRLAAIFSTPGNDELEDNQFITLITRQGMIKKSVLKDLPGPSSQKLTLIKVNSDDTLVSALLTKGDSTLFLATANGMSIRFAESEVRPMGLVAAGVNGMKLKGDDTIVGAQALNGGEDVVLVSSNGKGWRIADAEFPVQGRYGQGTVAVKLARGTTVMGCASGKRPQPFVVIYASTEADVLKIGEAPAAKRGAAGKDLPGISANRSVVRVTAFTDVLAYLGEEGEAELGSSKGGSSGSSKNGAGTSNGHSSGKAKAAVKGRASTPKKAAGADSKKAAATKPAASATKPAASATKLAAKKTVTAKAAAPAKPVDKKSTEPAVKKKEAVVKAARLQTADSQKPVKTTKSAGDKTSAGEKAVVSGKPAAQSKPGTSGAKPAASTKKGPTAPVKPGRKAQQSDPPDDKPKVKKKSSGEGQPPLL